MLEEPNAAMVAEFFSTYGAAEASAMCFAIAATPPTAHIYTCAHMHRQRGPHAHTYARTHTHRQAEPRTHAHTDLEAHHQLIQRPLARTLHAPPMQLVLFSYFVVG